MKQCAACGTVLPLTAFNRATASHDGRAATCRQCTNAARRGRRAIGGTNEVRTAIKRGDFDRVRSLCGSGGYPANRLLAIAVQNYNTAPKNAGHVAIVDYLIDRGAEPTEEMLLEAARDGNPAIVERLVAACPELSIVASAAVGDVARVKSLLERDPRLVNARTQDAKHYHQFTPLHGCCLSALGRGSPETTDRLLDAGQLLIAAGAELEAIGVFYGSLQVTPLDMLAHNAANLPLARELLDCGARITGFAFLEALGHRGRTLAEGLALAQLFLDAGFDINAMAWKGADGTALHAVANAGGAEAASWLIAHGADLNARGRMGRTPLHLAAERNTSAKTAQVLLVAGADAQCLDDLGLTPLEVAQRHGKRAVAKLLRDA